MLFFFRVDSRFFFRRFLFFPQVFIFSAGFYFFTGLDFFPQAFIFSTGFYFFYRFLFFTGLDFRFLFICRLISLILIAVFIYFLLIYISFFFSVRF